MENNQQPLPQTTSKESLKIYSPDVVQQSLATIKTANDALAVYNKVPSLAKLRKEFGSDKIEAIIKLYLIEITELVNLKRPLTEPQIEYIAKEVLSTYYMLTIADVHVIFRKIKHGEFGSMYESMDVPKVLKIFQLYFDERCEIAEYNSRNNGIYDKGDNITSATMTKYFNDLEKKLKK